MTLTPNRREAGKIVAAVYTGIALGPSSAIGSTSECRIALLELLKDPQKFHNVLHVYVRDLPEQELEAIRQLIRAVLRFGTPEQKVVMREGAKAIESGLRVKRKIEKEKAESMQLQRRRESALEQPNLMHQPFELYE